MGRAERDQHPSRPAPGRALAALLLLILLPWAILIGLIALGTDLL
jgi:hypothetical protein